METWSAFSFGLQYGECGAGALAREGCLRVGTQGSPTTSDNLPASEPTLPYRSLSDVFAFLLQTLIRPQHMIERFFFPDRTGSVKQLIDTMSSRALQTLQDVHERIRPALFIAEWQEKQYGRGRA